MVNSLGFGGSEENQACYGGTFIVYECKRHFQLNGWLPGVALDPWFRAEYTKGLGSSGVRDLHPKRTTLSFENKFFLITVEYT